MTKYKAYVFTYNRPEMLASVLESLDGLDVTVKHDGVDFKHRGKGGFWITWDEVLKDSINHNADIFLFMQDDCLDIDLERIERLHEQFKDKPYIYNIINDGRKKMWTSIEPRTMDEDTELCGFTDCMFFCNLKALIKLGFFMDDMSDYVQEGKSSGVGLSLTYRANRFGVPCYRPFKSLATHGDHESKMHPEERKINPLISK